MTLVLPVGGVEDYLPACLDSVFCQPDPPGGIEVIAVDDASADGCGAILNERAAREPRLRVIHLSRRAGPGPARMRGLAGAAGEYVWFVDPDDLLTDGSLAAVAGRLVRDRPDVLLLDYLSLHPDGRTEPSHGAGLLAAPPSVLTLADRPALIDRTMTSWSKVIARRFLVRLGVSFPAGIHEDVAVSCALLLHARRVALLDRVCYLYRQRPGSFLATPSPAHAAIFDAYDQVFRMLPADGEAVAAAVFVRAIEHYNSILASGLVPGRERREFFRRMAREFRCRRPAGYRTPPGLRGARNIMIERDAYLAYSLTVRLNNVRVSLRRRV
jgi:CDP-glycerol glycerophosphotransferase